VSGGSGDERTPTFADRAVRRTRRLYSLPSLVLRSGRTLGWGSEQRQNLQLRVLWEEILRRDMQIEVVGPLCASTRTSSEAFGQCPCASRNDRGRSCQGDPSGHASGLAWQLCLLPKEQQTKESAVIAGRRGSESGRVGDWRAGLGRSLCSPLPRPWLRGVTASRPCLRFQFPPPRTQSADFPHYAHLLASHQGLWDLSYWGDFRRTLSH
jgi:hypothetical protein